MSKAKDDVNLTVDLLEEEYGEELSIEEFCEKLKNEKQNFIATIKFKDGKIILYDFYPLA